MLLLARREYDTKARSHALTHAMRKKKWTFSPQGLEPWSTGVITFTWKPDMITTYTTANPFGNGTKRVSSRVLQFLLGIKKYTVYLFRVFFRFAFTAKKFYVSKILSSFYDKRCLSLDPLRRRSLLTRKLQYSVVNRQIECILRPLVPGTLFRVSSFRTRGARGNER